MNDTNFYGFVGQPFNYGADYAVALIIRRPNLKAPLKLMVSAPLAQWDEQDAIEACEAYLLRRARRKLKRYARIWRLAATPR